MKRAEQVGIIEVLQKKSSHFGSENVKSNSIPSSAPPLPVKSGSNEPNEPNESQTSPINSTNVSNVSTNVSTNGGTNSGGGTNSKFQTDFRKFMTGMSIKKT